jgi:AraC-like DNA-binding protein
MGNKKQKILKKGILALMLVIALNALISFFYYHQQKFLFAANVCFFLFIIHVVIWFITKNYSYEQLKVLMPFYVIFLLIIFFPEMYASFNHGELTGLFRLIPSAPLALLIFFPSRQCVVWSIVVSVAVICCYFLEMFALNLLPIPTLHQSFSPAQLKTNNLLIIAFAFISSSVPVYSHFQLTSLSNEQIENSEEEKLLMDENMEKKLTGEDIEKYNRLYKDILICFEEKKVYQDPELTISKLAIILNTNPNYIYQAIQLNNSMSFSSMVNFYRIKMIKDMIEDGWTEKYTLRHIYAAAGFKNQSTFNKVFKLHEGASPSDYIVSKRKKDDG